MKKLNEEQTENLQGGTNRQFLIAGVRYALGGVVGYTITAISGATAIKCWNS